MNHRTITARSLRLAAAAAAATMLLAACGSGDDTSSAGSSDGGKVSLEMWAWAPGVDKAAAEWNKTHGKETGIQVEVTKIPGGDDGGYQKMHSAVKAGNAPDLAQLEYEAIPGFVLEGELEDLNPFGADKVKDKFTAANWQQGVFGEGAYAVPQDSGPMGLFYRADLFEKWGIDVPKTWAEYEAAAKQIREKGAYISTFSPKSSGWFSGLAWQAGARWFGVDGETWQVGMDDPATKKVADYWQGLVEKKLVKTEPDSSNAWFKDIQTGQIATWVSARWGDGVIRGNAPDTAGKWRVAPMPEWDAGTPASGNFGGSATAVLKGTEHGEAALEFATWLNSDPASLAILTEEAGIWPAAKDKGDLATQKDEFYGGQNINEVFTAAEETISTDWRWNPNFSKTAETMVDGFKNAVDKNGDFFDALEAADKATLEDLKDKGLQAESK